MPRPRLAVLASLVLALCGCDSELPTPASQKPTVPPGAQAEDLTEPPDSDVRVDTRLTDADDGSDAPGDTPDDDLEDGDLDLETDADDVEPDPCPPGVLGTTEACAVESCLELKVRHPAAPNGSYMARLDDGTVGTVYCEMTLAGGGWTSLVRFDVSGASGCPTGWTPRQAPDACVRGDAAAGTFAAPFTSRVLAWSEIRGFVKALKFSTTDGFVNSGATAPDVPYADGVDILVGAQHLWTYAAGWQWPARGAAYNCPCSAGSPPPPFVGGHYACEAAAALDDSGTWALDNPLWSGPGVGAHCDVRGEVSWFERHLDAPTTETVQIRILLDEASDNEDIGIEAMSLFLREAERCEDTTAGADEDYDGEVDEFGCGPMNPAPSCAEILVEPGFAPSGVYWLQPRAGGPVVRAYCEMEIADGGWTLAAVCRQGSTGCHDPAAVGSPDSPWHATTAKLADEDIIALLRSGDRTTLGLWRTGARADVADSNDAVLAVVNVLDDPSAWSSLPCSTPADEPWTVQSTPTTASDLSIDPASLVDAALVTNVVPLAAAAGDCGCTASGWSNIAADSCVLGWGTRDESGPAAAHDGGTPEHRADVQLWVR